jgi:hypothetical protein
MARLVPHRLAISFVVDDDPVFAYTGWHLAHSLHAFVGLPWAAIHVQCTPEVPRQTVERFRALGCTTHELTRFGDGRFCNKLGQWDNLRTLDADHFLFLDTDMICVADLIPFLPTDAVAAKVVDLSNPSLSILDTLFSRAGFATRPETVTVEARNAETYRANCNGGAYSVPRRFAEPLFDAWRRHALDLLADPEILRAVGKESHVDQASFCMAVHDTGLPFDDLPGNANYFVHFVALHKCRDTARPIALLHYHNDSLNMLGLLAPAGAVEPDELAAVADANAQIRANFETQSFWDLRYRRFPDRGSGIGSRGDNLAYKRSLLTEQGAKQASSVLDVGCGDLAVVGALDLQNYTGIDRSAASLALAKEARPDWRFRLAPADDVATAELVLCFEVAIHQDTAADYHALIDFLAAKTERTLIISGYDEATEKIATNHMLYFYEPLRTSLEATGRFASVRRIGTHSHVTVYRCDVM